MTTSLKSWCSWCYKKTTHDLVDQNYLRRNIYKCRSCKDLTENKEHCNMPTCLIKGNKWLDNDIVNIFSIFSAVLIGALMMSLL